MEGMKKILLHFIFATLTAGPLLAEDYNYTYDSSNNCYSNTSCAKRFKLGGEWLYWQADQSQMEIGANVSATNGGATVNSSTIIPEFEYSNGYRFYLDYLLDDCWSVGAIFTHLPSNPSASASNDPASLSTNFIAFNDNLYPLFSAFAQSGIFFSSLDMQWDLNLYYLDSYIKRTFCFCHNVTIEPYLGLRGFWMKQAIQINADSPNAQGGATTLTANLLERFYGVGLLAGVDINWQLRSGISFVGKFGSSLVYSSANDDFNIQSTQLQITNKNKYKKAHPSIDTFIGLRYLKSFCRFTTEAHIGWENHLFLHTNQFSVATNGNLSVQGLTLGGSITF